MREYRPTVHHGDLWYGNLLYPNGTSLVPLGAPGRNSVRAGQLGGGVGLRRQQEGRVGQVSKATRTRARSARERIAVQQEAGRRAERRRRLLIIGGSVRLGIVLILGPVLGQSPSN